MILKVFFFLLFILFIYLFILFFVLACSSYADTVESFILTVSVLIPNYESVDVNTLFSSAQKFISI